MRFLTRPIPCLVVIGAALHCVLLLAAYLLTSGIDSFAFRSLDGREFYNLARNVAEHGVFSQDETPPLRPDTWRTPGYPLFLAACMLLGAKSAGALILVQQALSILNALLAYRVGRRLMSARRALVAGLLFLIEPYHLYYSLWLLSTTVFVTVLLLTWLLWQTAMRRGGASWFAVLGGVSGFLVLVWPGALLIPAGLLMEIIFSVIRRPREAITNGATRPAWVAVPAFAAVCVLVVGAWMMRNQLVAERFALSHQGGIVLAYFKASEVVLWSEGRAADRYRETSLDAARSDDPHGVWEDIDRQLRELLPNATEEQRAALGWRNLAQGNKTTVDSFAVSDALARIGWRRLTASPLNTLTCCVTRCASILTFPLDLSLAPPTGVATHRVRSALLGATYLALTVAALVRLVRGAGGYAGLYFPLACVVALLLTTTPQTDPRFRVPMIPLLIVIALCSPKCAATNIRTS